MFPITRPRRLRRTEALRELVAETNLSVSDLVWPVFIVDGERKSEPIAAMPDVSRYSVDFLLEEVGKAADLGIKGVALFPAVAEEHKDATASYGLREDGLVQRTIRAIKEQFPKIVIVSDVAMDPYSSDGHDGVVRDGVIVNDESLEILAEMAVSQAEAGADIVAPSDMMDGRVGAIRQRLDERGFSDVVILSYAAKYASSFYGPFRAALDSAPRSGDKKTYQMDYRNSREAITEAELDVAEGADILMVKPAGAYLDVIKELSQNFEQPIAAYQVSGEYSMIKHGAKAGLFDEQNARLESLTAIKRAGAGLIFSYFAVDAARDMV